MKPVSTTAVALPNGAVVKLDYSHENDEPGNNTENHERTNLNLSKKSHRKNPSYRMTRHPPC